MKKADVRDDFVRCRRLMRVSLVVVGLNVPLANEFSTERFKSVGRERLTLILLHTMPLKHTHTSVPNTHLSKSRIVLVCCPGTERSWYRYFAPIPTLILRARYPSRMGTAVFVNGGSSTALKAPGKTISLPTNTRIRRARARLAASRKFKSP
jgi:hypothetical protein